jgi:hypothetical protein
MADWPMRLYEHRGGREWSSDDHGGLWKHAGSVEVVPASQLRGAVEDLRTFAQAVLDLPCAFGAEGDPLAAQQRRAADLINTYREQ